MNSNQNGFSAVEPVIIVLVILLIGGGGYFVYERNQDGNKRNTVATTYTQKQEADQASKSDDVDTATPKPNLKLDGGKVSFTLPGSWTYKKQPGCIGFSADDADCREVVQITPGENLPTRYGDGTEYFHIYIGTFDNPEDRPAQDWLDGIGTGDVTNSQQSVNGYDTYRRIEQYNGDGTTIRELNYAFAVNGKVVRIKARTYEPGERNGQTVGDFRKFEPSVDALAGSIKIDY
jgi:hypothetical protein